MTLNDTYRTWNATNIFVVPLLKLERARISKLGLINAFIDDEIRNAEYKGVVYMLFKPTNLDEFNDLLEEERQKKIVIDEYDYPGGLVMVVCKYDEKYEKDVQLIMQGAFSKTSTAYQNSIKRTYQITHMGRTSEELTVQHQIFTKAKGLINYWYDKYGLVFDRNDEVWEFYPENEIFNQNTLNKLLKNDKYNLQIH